MMITIGIIIMIAMILVIAVIAMMIKKKNKRKKKKLIVLAIFKNETMNLKMWIQHYLWQGCDKIYLIDNGSTDNPLPILQPYMDKGLVVYRSRPEKYQQAAHYHHVIREEELLKKTEWLMICDLDEFFYSPSGNLASNLDSFKEHDIIYCNWLMFGSSGYKDHPSDIRTTLTYREPDLHSMTKYIVRTSAIKDIGHLDVHHASNIDRAITENEKIRLNHYPIQSWNYFEKVKMTRGDVGTPFHEHIRDEKYFKSCDKNSHYNDTTLCDLVLLHEKEYKE